MYTHDLYPNLPKKCGMVHLNSGTIHTKSQNWIIIDDVWIGQTVYLRFLTLFPDNVIDALQAERICISFLLAFDNSLKSPLKLTPVFFWNFTLHLWQIDVWFCSGAVEAKPNSQNTKVRRAS